LVWSTDWVFAIQRLLCVFSGHRVTPDRLPRHLSGVTSDPQP